MTADIGSIFLDRRARVGLLLQVRNQDYDPDRDQLLSGRTALVAFNKLLVRKGECFLVEPSFFDASFFDVFFLELQ